MDAIEGEDPVQMATISGFNLTKQLPVKLTLTEDITSIRLGVQVTNGEDTYFEALPDYTMFSLDEGASYYMVYGEYDLELVLQNMTSLPLLFDFSYAELDMGADLTLAMMTYVGDEQRNCYTVTTLPNQEKETAQIVTETEDETSEQLQALILTMDNKLEFTFPAGWEEAKLEYTVERLTMTEEQTLIYVPVNLEEEGLDAQFSGDEGINKLVIRLAQEYVTPGTYRVNMKWSYEDICYMETQTTFFINDFVHTAYTQGG